MKVTFGKSYIEAGGFRVATKYGGGIFGTSPDRPWQLQSSIGLLHGWRGPDNPLIEAQVSRSGAPSGCQAVQHLYLCAYVWRFIIRASMPLPFLKSKQEAA